MKESKYVGKTFGNWIVANIYLAGNYEHGTRHNAYRYTLERITSDEKCLKKIVVSGPTMKKIATGVLDIGAVAERKGIRNTNYEFINKK